MVYTGLHQPAPCGLGTRGPWWRDVCAGGRKAYGGLEGAGKARVLLIGHFGACFLSVCALLGAALCPRGSSSVHTNC